MDRRTFLKTASLSSIAFAWGCGTNSDRHIFSRVNASDDSVTGEAVWYASTCMECPAGCGIIAKNREGRVVKLEGNPHHPVNRGKLCIRGQAALQGVYDPDRLTAPRLKTNGTFKEISFPRALEILKQKTRAASERGKERIRMLTGITGEPLSDLFTETLAGLGTAPPAVFEPFCHESLTAAHQAVFNKSILPSFHMEHADFLLNFGADFLETWLSPVEYARKFKSTHAVSGGGKGLYIHAGPFMSLTAAGADKFFPVRAGTEYIAAWGILHRLLDGNSYDHLPESFEKDLRAAASGYTPSFVRGNTGLSLSAQKRITDKLVAAGNPLVLGSTAATADDSAFLLDTAATLINWILDENLSLYDFENRHSVENTMSSRETAHFFRKTEQDPPDLFLVYNANPVYSCVHAGPVEKLFQEDTVFKVCFSSFMDETARNSDLVFPVRHPLETWDLYAGKTGICSMLQPAMGKLTDAPSIGDVFLELQGDARRFNRYREYLLDRLYADTGVKREKDLLQMIQQGGVFEPGRIDTPDIGQVKPVFTEKLSAALEKAENACKPLESEGLRFLAVPSLRHFDGRGANKSWLSEIPDPVTNIAWESVLMIHPATLEEYGFQPGDLLEIEAGKQTIQAPVYDYAGVVPGLIVMQTGQGHTDYGRYARGFGENPLTLLKAGASNGEFASYMISPDKVKKAGTVKKLPKTYGSRSQHNRKIALSMKDGHAGDHGHAGEPGLDMERFPLTLPYEAGYDEKRDVYPAHEHDGYRWGMIVDLDRCVGCSACAAACYAENNIGIAGREQVIKGREMAWLRIERYRDRNFEERLIFLPMMCQHCDNAPCESVCPVYAPHHSKEGLNNQIYNRCIGTRFCAQNCPYKVRRFNWYEWGWPEPLNLQLNPDVTARTKGVMEKCSFCIQRIKQAHNRAKNENRQIRDKEIRPACVQTCPTGALVFGNFLDPKSAVSRLAQSSRAYQVLGYLNTKPAVIYLKKVVHDV